MLRYISLSLFVLLIIYATSCSEIFYPKTKSNSELLVVDGVITDGNGPFVIKLNNAAPYGSDSSSTSNPVTGANLSIIDNNGLSCNLTETSAGNYTTPASFVTKVGNSYKLQIKTSDGSIYESNSEQLLAPQTYDSIRSIYASKEYLSPDKNSLVSLNGADVRVDLFNAASSSQSRCRFTTGLTVQYIYTAQVPWYNKNDLVSKGIDACSFLQDFGWASNYTVEQGINVTDENTISTNHQILNHEIGFIPFNASYYQINVDLSLVNPGISTSATIPNNASLYFYFIMHQYTLNDDSYAFYEAAKEQLNATGEIFDPITAQLIGNVTCINNPSKIAVGLFEVSSVVNSAFFMFQKGISATVIHKEPIISIPANNQSWYMSWECDSVPPASVASRYVIIPYPSWWWHGFF
jgi:hypothetical protein